MGKKNEKKSICISISKEILSELNHTLIDRYNNTFGHISESFEGAIKIWLQNYTKKAETIGLLNLNNINEGRTNVSK